MSAQARTVAAGLALAVIVGVLAQRAARRINVPGQVAPQRWVLQDFRDAIYYPAVAFLDGHNPYDQTAQATTYPVGQSFPLYLPLTLLVHAPFAWLEHGDAGLAYAATTVVLCGFLAALAMGGAGAPVTAAGVLLATALLLASRPGSMNLLLGQVTAQVVIGAYVALRWARVRPWLAGAGLALSSLKPTYGVVLAVLMLLGRGDVAAVVRGTLLSTLFCLVALVPLVGSAGGVQAFIASLGSSAAAFSAESTSNAWASFARLDVTALAARVLGRAPAMTTELTLGAAVVAVAVAALRRLRGDERAPTEQLGVGLACLTVLIATYHQTYDALILAQPAAALAFGRWGRGAPAGPALRWGMLALIAVPALSYFASHTVAGRVALGEPVWLVMTSVTPLAMLIAWGGHVALACRRGAA